MPVKPIVRLMPHAVTRPGHRPRRLSLAAGLAAAAAVVACLAAGSASAAPARPARPGTAGSAGTAAVQSAAVVRAAGLFHPVLQPRPVPGGLRRGAAAAPRDHRQRRDRGDARTRQPPGTQFHRHPQGPGRVRQEVRPARGEAHGHDHPRRGQRALRGGHRGGRGHRDRARDSARCRPRRGPRSTQLPRPARRTSPRP